MPASMHKVHSIWLINNFANFSIYFLFVMKMTKVLFILLSHRSMFPRFQMFGIVVGNYIFFFFFNNYKNIWKLLFSINFNNLLFIILKYFVIIEIIRWHWIKERYNVYSISNYFFFTIESIHKYNLPIVNLSRILFV